jgi:ureidoglycolate lyase
MIARNIIDVCRKLMAEICIPALPLTRKAFAPFGDMIETPLAREVRTINEGNTQRFHNLGVLQAGESTLPLVNIFRSQPIHLPFQIKWMERHPRASQFFFPLDPEPYLVVVADAGPFCVENIRAFVAQPKQGVIYHPGTWHHYSMALNRVSDFLVLDRDDLPGNCDEVSLHQSVFIDHL